MPYLAHASCLDYILHIKYNKVNDIFFLSVSKVCAKPICSEGICPGGKCPGGICPRGYLSRGLSVLGVHVRGGGVMS